ncbi:TonB-dependent receptor plug domain-containing protein [Luteimonas suaedae]|uniref:TonB-dependent receptor plug domain-containing protein n=1 Tax=Luteimonas suaedae TaxID=2605430 RepID=UPI001659B7E4|nr:TonB-dependent receptor [Luteimonas suaedae]
MQYSTFHRNALASALALALFPPFAALAQAQDAQQPPPAEQAGAPAETGPDENARTLDTVTVTGSRIKRAEIEGPAPVTIITGEQIRKEGFTTIYEALSSLTEVTGTVQNDYDWGQSSVNASPLNLRNLGPGRSLLLINGHRVADYPLPYTGKSNFANYNNIPTGIVERIEVLASGASAIYGSDAVAGVVNVILKKDIEGDTLRARYGTTTEGGRSVREASWSGGRHGEDWSVAYTLQYFDRKPLWSHERPFMDEESDSPRRNWGYGGVQQGVATNTPQVGIRLYDVASDQRIRPPAGACDQFGGDFYEHNRILYNDFNGAQTDTGWQCANRSVFQYWTLRNGSKDLSAYVYGTKQFGDVEAWATVGYWDSTGKSNTFMPDWDSPNYIDAGSGREMSLLRYFVPSEIGGIDRALTKSKETNWDFNAGLRGTVFNDRFDWDLMAGRAEYELREHFPTIHEERAAEFFLGPSLGIDPATGLDIRAPDYDRLWNPVSRGGYDSVRAVGDKQARTWLTQASFVLSGDLFEGWAGPIGFAGVVEAARQGYELRPDPNTLGTDPVYGTPFGNIETGGGDRNRYAVGVEFKVPLLETLTLSAAGRYDRYDAVADDAKNTYNLGLEWRPFPSLLLRSSYATSFRAPDMHFVYADASESVSDQTDYYACLSDPNRQTSNCPGGTGEPYHIDNPVITRQGTQDLLYETGDSLTYGFVWDAFDGFSVSADYWRIDIENAIDDVGPDDVLLDEALCRLPGSERPLDKPERAPPSQALCDLQTGRVTRDDNGMVTRVEVGPINRAQQSVSGVDVASRYQLSTAAWGTFDFALNWTKQLTYKVAQFPGDPFENSRDRDRQMRYRGRASASWNIDKWTTVLFVDWIAGRRSDRYGGCTALPNGFRPDVATDCTDLREDPDTGARSITYGQQSELVDYYNQDQIYWNTSVGYQATEALRLNLYVNNIFDDHYQDKWCGGFAYCVANPVGREVAAEVVYRFD